MSECSGNCSSCSSNCDSKKQDLHIPGNPMSDVKKVIGVVSGKGGVGKSFVTSSLAVTAQTMGYQTAILDADITGPSIPKAFGIKGKAYGQEEFLPLESEGGVKIMSLNLLVADDTDPVIWRGPVIAGTVTQFWTDVVWGDVDYMFVDMPPGTGDVPLTVFQSLPVTGIVIVTSPQELVQLIVKKAYNMANMMNIPVLGIVENFSFLKCPDCGKEIKVFGESHIDKTAQELGVEVLGKLPIEPEFAKAADDGKFYEIEHKYLEKAEEVLESIDSFTS